MINCLKRFSLRCFYLKAFVIIILVLPKIDLYPNIKNQGYLLGFYSGYISAGGILEQKIQPGFGLGLTGLYFSSWRYLFYESNFHYNSFESIKSPGSALTQLSLALGPGLYLSLSRWFEPFIVLQGGMNSLFINLKQTNIKTNTLKLLGVGKVGFMSSPFRYISFRLEGSYGVNELSGDIHSYYQASFSVMMRTEIFSNRNLVPKKESLVQIEKIELRPIFGSRYSVYEDEGIGFVKLVNKSNQTLTDIKVNTSIDEIKSGPTPSIVIDKMEPQEELEVNLPLLINQDVLRINESRKLALNIQPFYKEKRGVYSYIENTSILVHSKNTITWDNTAYIGSFITPKDSEVTRYARKVLSYFKKKYKRGIPIKLQQAMILFNSLGTLGISYVTDPNTGFSKVGKDTLDYVMYFQEAMKNNAGDCDDLTVLYASLLESVGINTAIVTSPGHIFLMFNTEEPANNYQNISHDKSKFHLMNGTVWIPVEITKVGNSFLDAWQEGINNLAKMDFAILETKIAWIKYPPSDVGKTENVKIPNHDVLSKLCIDEIKELKKKNYDEQLVNLLNKYKEYKSYKKTRKRKKKDEYLQTLNSIGITYAKYGEYNKAVKYFNLAIKTSKKFIPAYSNLGNVYLLQKKYKAAINKYKYALKIAPTNHKYRLNLSRAYYEDGQIENAKKEYVKSVKDYPGYKIKYAYLSRLLAARASELEERLNSNLWQD